MIPPAFEYLRAGSVEEAVTALADHGDEARLLAGGHSLVPLMKLRLACPALLVDVGRLDELSYVRLEDDIVRIGALTRHRDLETSELLAQHVPLLRAAAHHVGDPQVRARGTIGGSLAHGDPASDLAAVTLALGGTLVVRGPTGVREIGVDSFWKGFLETDLAFDEMLIEIRVPAVGEVGWSFQKFSRRAMDWAVVGAAVVHGVGLTGVGLVNMDSRPVRAGLVEQALRDGVGITEAAERAAEGCRPPSDLSASAEYRSHLARVLVRRALEEAASRSLGA